METREEVREEEAEAWRETSDKSISWVWCGNLEVPFTMELTGVGRFQTGGRGWDENMSIVCAHCSM